MTKNLDVAFARFMVTPGGPVVGEDHSPTRLGRNLGFGTVARGLTQGVGYEGVVQFFDAGGTLLGISPHGNCSF